MLAEQRDTEMGVRRRSASVASSGSRNTRSTLCKPWSRWIQPCGRPTSRKPAPRVPTSRAEELRGESYVRRPRVGVSCCVGDI